jgi:hypothetical protein
MPIKKSIQLVEHGQFAVTHSPYTPENCELFSDFKKVLLVRNITESIRSFDRWSKATGRPNLFCFGEEYIHKFKDIAKWQSQPDIFTMNFNDMKNENIEKLDELQMHLFGIVKHNSKEIITQALAADTLTKIRGIHERKTN